MRLLFFFISALLAQTASAIIYSNSSFKSPAIVALGGRGYCSGVVVGLKPLTILTARHCSEKGVVEYMNQSPDVVVTSHYNQEEFSVERSRLPGDISVLIFKTYKLEISEESLFVIEPFELQHWQEIMVCGYGSNKPEARDTVSGLNFQRCGTTSVHLDDPRLNFYDSGPGKNFSKLSQKRKVRILHSVIQGNLLEYGAGSRVGVAAIHKDGTYDRTRTQTLMKSGDSGGPAFIRNPQGRNVLIGINSLETINDGNVEGGIIWRIDHPSSQDVLQRARSAGADL